MMCFISPQTWSAEMNACRLILLLWATTSYAVADDPEKPLKERLKDLNGQNADHWIYNDISCWFCGGEANRQATFYHFSMCSLCRLLGL
jgi:hypothetical protein